MSVNFFNVLNKKNTKRMRVKEEISSTELESEIEKVKFEIRERKYFIEGDLIGREEQKEINW